MEDLAYSFRVSRWTSETTYRQDENALHWTGPRLRGSVRYGDVAKVQTYKFRYFGSKASYWRCVLHCTDGRKIRLQAAHYAGFRRIEDRTATYIPFIKQLESRIAAVNPSIFSSGTNWVALVDTCSGHGVVLVLGLARLVPLEAARRTGAWLARNIGPLLKGHRIARANLTAAFPDKPPQEIDRILAGMWDNLGRVFAEYAHLDRIWDYDPARAEPGQIVLDEASRKRFLELRSASRPQLMFGAHLANWELLCWSCGAYDGPSGIVYRPVNIAPLDRKLLDLRSRSKTSLIPANSDAMFAIKRLLQRRGCFGMLVDEHFPRGTNVTFFGRECTVTPLLARYARQFDCAIHGTHMVRLPGGKFKLDITDALVPPRDAAGKIDVAATMQMVTHVIEGWVREHPEQWLWIQRRWR